MTFDQGLAERVREVLARRSGIAERGMFGGLAFLLDGRMVVAVSGSKLMARVGMERYADALALPHVREMKFTGRVMKGYVYIDPPALTEDGDLAAWVDWCAGYVAGLPPKVAK
jgi:TfoX N-terminal domain